MYEVSVVNWGDVCVWTPLCVLRLGKQGCSFPLGLRRLPLTGGFHDLLRGKVSKGFLHLPFPNPVTSKFRHTLSHCPSQTASFVVPGLRAGLLAAFADFMSLCHVSVILAIFPAFTLLHFLG